MKIFFSLILICSIFMISCGKKTAHDKIIGKWKYEEVWTTGNHADYPHKEDSNYAAVNNAFKESLSSFLWFYGKEMAGTITTEGDTLRLFPYKIEKDSILIGEFNMMEYIRFEDDDHLILIQGDGFTKLSRVK